MNDFMNFCNLLTEPLIASLQGAFDTPDRSFSPSRAVQSFADATTAITRRLVDLNPASAVPADTFAIAQERRKQLLHIIYQSALKPAIFDTFALLFPWARQGAGAVSITPLPPSTIPLQWRYRGRGPITEELADTSCRRLGIHGMLEELNRLLGTRYSSRRPGLRTILQDQIDKGNDFGTAYGILRPWWRDGDFVRTRRHLRSNRQRDEKMRSDAVHKDRVVRTDIPPRRVWDLYSNRVIPFWALSGTKGSTAMPADLWAVSHCWIYGDDSKRIRTNINGRQWPVHMPRGTSLEHVRVELLNYGAKYVWLDVLCLMQKGCRNAAQLQREVALDVPTIGYIYQWHRYQTVITYFNGLGRPFVADLNAVNRDHHWLQRAWTLQETNVCWLPAGINATSLLDFVDFGKVVGGDGLIDRLHKLWKMLVHNDPDFFAIIQVMQERHSENRVDRVAGVAYLLRCPSFPVYKPDEHPENAWARLISHMRPRHRADILFRYPSPSTGERKQWCPTWKQLMLTKDFPARRGIRWDKPVQLQHSRESGAYYHYAYVIRGCEIHGLGHPSRYQRLASGTMTVRDHTFGITVDHAEPIPSGEYIMVGAPDLEHWVVAKLVKESSHERKLLTVKKVSVVRMTSSTDRKRLGNVGVPDTKVAYI